MTRRKRVMCAPESTDSPIASASSWIAVSTICSGRLVQPGVDDLHAGVAQRAGDHLGTPVMAVQPGLGHHDPDPCLHFRPLLHRATSPVTESPERTVNPTDRPW